MAVKKKTKKIAKKRKAKTAIPAALKTALALKKKTQGAVKKAREYIKLRTPKRGAKRPGKRTTIAVAARKEALKLAKQTLKEAQAVIDRF